MRRITFAPSGEQVAPSSGFGKKSEHKEAQWAGEEKKGYFNETHHCSPVPWAPRASVQGSQWGHWQRKQGQFCGVGACFCGVWLRGLQTAAAYAHDTGYQRISAERSFSCLKSIKTEEHMWTGQTCQLGQDISLCCCGGPKSQWEVPRHGHPSLCHCERQEDGLPLRIGWGK